MANIKQQVKRVLTNEKRHERNAAYKSSVKTAMKAVKEAVAAKNKDLAVKALADAFKRLDQALAKGIVKKNYVANHKSELSLLVNSL